MDNQNFAQTKGLAVSVNETLLLNFASELRALADRMSLANQKVEGIVRRAGFPIDEPRLHQPPAGDAGAVPVNDIALVGQMLEEVRRHTFSMEALADALEALA